MPENGRAVARNSLPAAITALSKHCTEVEFVIHYTTKILPKSTYTTYRIDIDECRRLRNVRRAWRNEIDVSSRRIEFPVVRSFTGHRVNKLGVSSNEL